MDEASVCRKERVGKIMITDNEAIKAMNTLIDYCNEPKLCRDCVIEKHCDALKEAFKGFCELEHIEKMDELPNRIEAEKLAPNMAAAIMNRKD